MKAWVFSGQGSQHKGMGEGLFEQFPTLCDKANQILGYSIQELCLHDPDNNLGLTQYAQPALFIISALNYLVEIQNVPPPQFLAGHSLGEFNALFAAGCFDFETGLRLVKKRGELMGQVNGGSMIAVLGIESEKLIDYLTQNNLVHVDVANYNTASQIALSGPTDELKKITKALDRKNGIRCIPLNVSAAFHSRYMRSVSDEYSDFIRQFTFSAPQRTVISNVTALPYTTADQIYELLSKQIYSPVRWYESMQFLLKQGVNELEEIKPGRILTKMWQAARDNFDKPQNGQPHTPTREVYHANNQQLISVTAKDLGCPTFCQDYRVRYAYLAGSMYKGISSSALVIRMAQAGLMGFFGTGGLSLERIEDEIKTIQKNLGREGAYGLNFLHTLDDPAREQALIDLYLQYDIRFIEAAAFMQITAPLIHFRFKDAYIDAKGNPVAARHVIAKVSRPEVAQAFMQPAPEHLLHQLVQNNQLTEQEAKIARLLPISDDICVEADSGGHTDAGVALTLIPTIIRLRDQMMESYAYAKRIRVGASGGIGTPEAAAAVFMLGADFILTGSVNQCSPEAANSPAVKDMLAQLNVQDTTYAPAGDMFELGAQVQVVRKGTLFPARANKLFHLYRTYESLEQIDVRTRRAVEEQYFKKSFDQVWQETKDYYVRSNQTHEIEKALRNPKHKMALVFKWYFIHTTRIALEGDKNDQVNFQVHCGPAMGAFNQSVKGTHLEDWHNRHVDMIADYLMNGAAKLFEQKLQLLCYSQKVF